MVKCTWPNLIRSYNNLLVHDPLYIILAICSYGCHCHVRVHHITATYSCVAVVPVFETSLDDEHPLFVHLHVRHGGKKVKVRVLVHNLIFESENNIISDYEISMVKLLVDI